MDSIDISDSIEIYTVNRLNREARFLLENEFPLLWIEGEISNFASPHSGHWYFSLKDAMSQVKCAMFRPFNRKIDFLPKDGGQVLLKARASLYEGRGDFQLLVEHMEEAGIGKLREAFDALKKRLSLAGLFDTAHKKSFPVIPKQIGIITSSTGAAVHDILSVLNRRFSCANIIIYPTLVQGDLAASGIVKAIEIANKRQECDVIILARGGGSLEDLWPFNEEKVAYAIYHSNIPIISGIGHEIDFTIADFVADQRAPTPTAAAELITPDQNELLLKIQQYEKNIMQYILRKLYELQQHIVWSNKQLQQQHPKRRIREQMQHLDLSEIKLIHLQNKLLSAYQAQLSTLAAKLDTLSPLSTLKRGYTITTRCKDQHILRHTNEVDVGDNIQVQLMDGKIECVVNNKYH